MIEWLRRLESKATPLPWAQHPNAPGAVHNPLLECWIPHNSDDSELIAAMRNALPEIIAFFDAYDAWQKADPGSLQESRACDRLDRLRAKLAKGDACHA